MGNRHEQGALNFAEGQLYVLCIFIDKRQKELVSHFESRFCSPRVLFVRVKSRKRCRNLAQSPKSAIGCATFRTMFREKATKSEAWLLE